MQYIYLSNSTKSAKDRIFQSAGPYLLINGNVVANNFQDLTDGTLKISIFVDENFESQPPSGSGSAAVRVWTATKEACDDWTVNAGVSGLYGELTTSSFLWTKDDESGCGNSHRLYCFQQP